MEHSTLAVILSLFVLLFIAIGVFFVSKRAKLPYTVMLVFSGMLLVPISYLPHLSFITAFELTPGLLFYVFLPTLIFESAFNMKVSRVLENVGLISVLAIGSMLVSSFLIATGLYYIFFWIGLPVPYIVFLIFGTLISATDPVAVLSLFKEYGAPERLSLLFEGESLFNDGTAFVLFLVLLDIVRVGWNGFSSVTSGILMFLSMTIGGILFGLFMGILFSKIIQFVKDKEHIEITLTMIVAHLTFLIAELISNYTFFGDKHIYISSIIATVVASMVVGNYGRSKISPRVLEYMERFWSYFAFVVNSIIFILVGLLFSKLPVEIAPWLLPIVFAIGVTVIARAVSIYPLVTLYNRFSKEASIPNSWQHLLAWGSLRGALAITMVFMIPDDLTVSGWMYEFSIKDLIMTITIGSIYFTLFVKATTMGPLMKKLKLNELTDIEKMELEESRAMIYAKALFKLARARKKKYISDIVYSKLHAKYEQKYVSACKRCNKVSRNSQTLQNRIMYIYAIGIERIALKSLYTYDEITEKIFKKIDDELLSQMHYLEIGRKNKESLNLSYHEDTIEHLKYKLDSYRKEKRLDRFMYYRARNIIARKVHKELKHLKKLEIQIFSDSNSITKTIKQYKKFEKLSKEKIERVQRKYPKIIAKFELKAAERGVLMNEEILLKNLHAKEMITPKVYIMLKEEFENNSK